VDIHKFGIFSNNLQGIQQHEARDNCCGGNDAWNDISSFFPDFHQVWGGHFMRAGNEATY
jgi:hypothetical protein